MLDFLRRLFGFHDSNGLRYSIDHLKRIERDIIFYPIEEQAKYADAVVTELINDVSFNSDILASLYLSDFKVLNATAIGNVAFVALNSPYEEVRVKSRAFLLTLRVNNSISSPR